MPQLNFLSPDEGCRFSIDYWSNPLHPENHTHFSISIADHKGAIVRTLYTQVPLEVTHELPMEVGRACWEAWLFGEMNDVAVAFSQVSTKWKAEAHNRRRIMELGGPYQHSS